MKKILGLAVAIAFVLSTAVVFAQAKAPAAAPAPDAAKKAAEEVCKKANPTLAGAALDECVKKEIAKTEKK